MVVIMGLTCPVSHSFEHRVLFSSTSPHIDPKEKYIATDIREELKDKSFLERIDRQCSIIVKFSEVMSTTFMLYIPRVSLLVARRRLDPFVQHIHETKVHKALWPGFSPEQLPVTRAKVGCIGITATYFI